MLGWIFRWDSDLNYKAISVMYTVACVVAVALYTMEKRGSLPQVEWTSNLSGAYIVLLPYVPCLIWVLLTHAIHRRTSLETSISLLATKKDQ
jgi:hypothetical protein